MQWACNMVILIRKNIYILFLEVNSDQSDGCCTLSHPAEEGIKLEMTCRCRTALPHSLLRRHDAKFGVSLTVKFNRTVNRFRGLGHRRSDRVDARREGAQLRRSRVELLLVLCDRFRPFSAGNPVGNFALSHPIGSSSSHAAGRRELSSSERVAADIGSAEQKANAAGSLSSVSNQNAICSISSDLTSELGKMFIRVVIK